LNLAKERKEILAYQIVSGGFEFGETTNNLYSFKNEEALSEWLQLEFADEKESDHKEGNIQRVFNRYLLFRFIN